jgi:hypothetical protein
MKRNKLNQYESKISLEPSPEQIQQAKQTFVNLLTPVIEKMLKSPGDIKPVAESFEELARQAKFGVPREFTKIISGGAEKVIQLPTSDTKIISGGQENSGKSKFTDLELELIRQIENGE